MNRGRIANMVQIDNRRAPDYSANMSMSNEHRTDTAEWVSPYEAARLLGGAVSRGTLHRWAQEGKLTAIRLPNGWVRISRKAVEDLLTPVTPEDNSPDPGQMSLLDDETAAGCAA